MEFNTVALNFTCPFCQGLCSCATCRRRYNVDRNPLRIDPCAPALYSARWVRDTYEPPEYAKPAWELAEESWNIYQRGKSKDTSETKEKLNCGSLRKRTEKSVVGISLSAETTSQVNTMKKTKRRYFVGRDIWKAGPDEEWERERAVLLDYRKRTAD